MPEMNYNTQYQDLINKLIQSKPKPTIDPLTQMLLSIGGSPALRTTDSPQTNRLGEMLGGGMKVYTDATDEQNKGMRLWDAQNVDFLRAVLTDETAKAKAKAEGEQRTIENQFKQNEDLRKQEDEKRKIAEGIAFGKMVTEIPNIPFNEDLQGIGQSPVSVISKKFKPYMGRLSGEEAKNVSSDLRKQILEAVKERVPHAPNYVDLTDGKRIKRFVTGSKEHLHYADTLRWNVVKEGVGGIDKKAEKSFEIVDKLNDIDIIKKSGWAVENNNGRLKFIERKTWYGGKIKPTEQMVTLLNNAQGHIDSLGEGGQGGSSGGMLMDEAIAMATQIEGQSQPNQEKPHSGIEPQSDINMQEAYRIYMTDSTGTKLIERYGQEGAKKIRDWVKINIEGGGMQPSSSLKVNTRP